MTSLLLASNQLDLLENLPAISLGTAALLIFGAIASLAVIRGLLRIFSGTLIICAAGFLAFLSWKYTPQVERVWPGTSHPDWITIAIPVITFILVIVSLRLLLRLIIRPFGQPNEETANKNRRSLARWAVTLVLAIIPAAILWFSGIALLRHFGSIEEIRDYSQSPHDESSPLSFLTRLKSDVEQFIPTEWFERIDPATERARIAFAKLLTISDDPPPKAIPILEEDLVRHSIESDPKLKKLAREGRIAELLRHPHLTELMENEKLRDILNQLDL